jgi:predicted transcriptional regulator
MNAMAEPQAFNLPKKPRIKQQEPPPDQRRVAVIPIRACTDRQLTEGMIRALILICSYCNKAGITWVSQKTLADKLGITQQAISKHLVKLTKAGYLQVLKRPVPGEKHTTWRVVFDPSVSAEDAVAITSSQEDTRPPYMKEQQAREAEQPDPEGQRKIAQLIATVLKQPVTKKEHTMPKSGQSITVQKMHEEIAKAGKKRQPKAAHTQPPEVVHQAQPHAQPKEGGRTTSKGCAELMNKDLYKDYVLNNQQLQKLFEAGMTNEQIRTAADTLLPIYRAEGLTPTADLLTDSILQLHRDTA